MNILSGAQSGKVSDDIVFICTANICRSPVAAAMLGSRIQAGLKEFVHLVDNEGNRFTNEPTDSDIWRVAASCKAVAAISGLEVDIADSIGRSG